MSISGLDSMALGLTVYASQGGSPLHHARLVSGCWPSSAGRDSLTRRVATKGFCVRVTSSFLELFLTQRHPIQTPMNSSVGPTGQRTRSWSPEAV